MKETEKVNLPGLNVCQRAFNSLKSQTKEISTKLKNVLDRDDFMIAIIQEVNLALLLCDGSHFGAVPVSVKKKLCSYSLSNSYLQKKQEILVKIILWFLKKLPPKTQDDFRDNEPFSYEDENCKDWKFCLNRFE